MSGELKRALSLVVVSAAVFGFGCTKRNPTPFVLPKGPPPAPIANAVLPGPATAASKEVPVTVYLISMDGTGSWGMASATPGSAPIGCGDFAVPVRTVAEGDPIAPMRLTIERLLAVTQDEAKRLGYYTSLTGSAVTVDGISKDENGIYTVALKGQFISAGECDDPRIKEQVSRTVGQFGKFRILLNGSESAWRCFGDLSGMCK